MTPLVAVVLKGLIVMLAAALATRLLQSAPASTRHGIWVAAFAALLLLPILEAAGPRWTVGVLPSVPASVALPTLPAPPPPPVPPAPPAPPAFAHLAETDEYAFEATIQEFEGEMAAFEGEMAAFEGEMVAFESSMETVHESPGRVAVVRRWVSPVLPSGVGGLLLGVWVLGAVVVVLRWLAATLAARHLVTTSRTETDDEWGVLTEHARRISGLEGPVRLARTDALDVPVAWGWGQPTVVLPADADDWDDDRREAVLLHEMAHLARRDAWTQAVAQSALAIHWPNPLVWWGYRRFLDAREQACDDAVIRSGARPSAYAAHLVGVARSIRRERLALSALAPMARTAPLEDRVVSILDASQARDRIGRPALVGLVALAAAVVVPIAALQPVTQARPAPLPQPNWTATADTPSTLYNPAPVAPPAPPARLDDLAEGADVSPQAEDRPRLTESRSSTYDPALSSPSRPVAEPAPPVLLGVDAIVEEAVRAVANEIVVDIDEVRNQIELSIQDLEGDMRPEAAIERQALHGAQRGLVDFDPKTQRARARSARDSVRRSERRRDSAVDWAEIDRARHEALRHTRSTP